MVIDRATTAGEDGEDRAWPRLRVGALRLAGDARQCFRLDIGSRTACWYLLADLDELPVLDRAIPGFAHNRAALVSLHDRDHGPRDGVPLRPWIEARLAEAGIDLEGGPIRLLGFPRVLGYVFNPLSVWFCHGPEGELPAILYAVSTRSARPITTSCRCAPATTGR